MVIVGRNLTLKAMRATVGDSVLLSHFDHLLPFNWYSSDIEVQKLDVLSWI